MPAAATRARPRTFDHLRSAKKPRRSTVDLVLDPEVAEDFATAKRSYELAETLLKGEPTSTERKAEFDAAKSRLDKVTKAARDVTFSITFRSIGPSRYEDLKHAHLASAEEKKAAEARGLPDIELSETTWPVALIAACAEEPALSEDEVREIRTSDAFNRAEFDTLYFTCLSLNEQRAVVDLGKGSRGTLG